MINIHFRLFRLQAPSTAECAKTSSFTAELTEMTKQLALRITEAVIGATMAVHSKFEAENKDSGSFPR
jgi:hypothetical protein